MGIIFSSPQTHLFIWQSVALFPLLHLPVLCYTSPCYVPVCISYSIVFVYFPSLFLLCSPKSHTFLSFLFPSGIIVPSAIVIDTTQLSCFSLNLFLDNFLYTNSWGWQKCLWSPLVSLPPLSDTLCFISPVRQRRCYYWIWVLVEGIFLS